MYSVLPQAALLHATCRTPVVWWCSVAAVPSELGPTKSRQAPSPLFDFCSCEVCKVSLTARRRPGQRRRAPSRSVLRLILSLFLVGHVHLHSLHVLSSYATYRQGNSSVVLNRPFQRAPVEGGLMLSLLSLLVGRDSPAGVGVIDERFVVLFGVVSDTAGRVCDGGSRRNT